ncbi:glycosyltransferase family 2 protein [Methylobacterium nodulans]|nr:glycosyltransferase [Methylobacterium nodulans]
MSAPLVSVVIPHVNDLANLERCLDLLAAQTLPPGTVEVVVADNGSAAGLAAVEALAAGRARVVPAPIRGAGPARNAGVAAARGNILAFIDSDCRPAPDWLEQGLKALDAADIVGGAVRVEAENRAAPTPVEAFELVFAFRNDLYVQRKGFTVTANMLVRRTVFEAVGPFANGLSEDVEWCHRARARGYRLAYAPAARVAHPARRTWEELVRKWRRTTREAYLLAAPGPLGRLPWLARAWLVLLSALPHAVKVLRAPVGGLRARLRAAGILLRIRSFRFAEAHRLAFGRHAEAAR